MKIDDQPGRLAGGNPTRLDDNITRVECRFGRPTSVERLGKVLCGKWTLNRLLGEGGMGAVYEATHRNGHRSAVKMLHERLAQEPLMVRRFLQEGYLGNRVPHPGRVRVFDDGCDEEGTPFLVMELLLGHSLAEHENGIRPGLELGQAVAFLIELLGILEAAHAAGIIHRDVKPANLFRTAGGELRLLDFGIALLRDHDSGPAVRTRTGVVLGTPAYMAPEQARARKELVGPSTDVWAAAASAVALLRGARLRRGSTVAEELAAAATRPFPPVEDLDSRLHGALADVLNQALAFDPPLRFASAADMVAALQSCRVQPEPNARRETLPLQRGQHPPHVASATLPLGPAGSVLPPRIAPELPPGAGSTRRLVGQLRPDPDGRRLGRGLLGVGIAAVAMLLLARATGPAARTREPVRVTRASVAPAAVRASVEAARVDGAETDAGAAIVGAPLAASTHRPARPRDTLQLPVPPASPSPSASGRPPDWMDER